MLVTRIGKRKIYTKWHNIQYIHLVQLSMVPRLLRCSIAKWKPCNSFSSFLFSFLLFSVSVSVSIGSFFSSSYSTFGSWFNSFYTLFFSIESLSKLVRPIWCDFPTVTWLHHSFLFSALLFFFECFWYQSIMIQSSYIFFSTISFRISLISIRKKFRSIQSNRNVSICHDQMIELNI